MTKKLDLSQFDGATPGPWFHENSYLETRDAKLVLQAAWDDAGMAVLGFVSDVDRSLILAAPDLLAEVKALRAATQWRPIETAPKDGARVLAWCTCCEDYQIAWRRYGLWWRSNYDGSDARIDAEFWAPLPAAPEGEA